MGITPDAGVDELLDRLVGEIRRSLDGTLVGVYLYGSLATGDFDPERSDIDLLAVVASEIDGEEFERLDSIHRRFVEDHPAWDDRIEVAYVSAAAMRKFKTEMGDIAVVSPGEPFHIKEADRGWLMNWYMVREIGVTLFGPPPGTLIPEVSKAEFLEAVRENSREWAGWVYGMRHPGAQSYAVLTMCRALYAHTNGEQASKKEAALWAQQRLPQWGPLIRWAWDWRREALEDEAEAGADFPETVRFVHDVIGRVTGERTWNDPRRGDAV